LEEIKKQFQVNFIWKIDMNDNEPDIRKPQEALRRI